MSRNESADQHRLHPYWKGASAFAVIVGVAMLLLWGWQYLGPGIPEMEIRPLATGLQFAGHVVTALLLLAAGLALMAGKRWARNAYLVGIGALLLSVVNAVAFYGERDDIGLVVFFIALAVVGVFFAIRAEE